MTGFFRTAVAVGLAVAATAASADPEGSLPEHHCIHDDAHFQARVKAIEEGNHKHIQTLPLHHPMDAKDKGHTVDHVILDDLVPVHPEGRRRAMAQQRAAEAKTKFAEAQPVSVSIDDLPATGGAARGAKAQGGDAIAVDPAEAAKIAEATPEDPTRPDLAIPSGYNTYRVSVGTDSLFDSSYYCQGTTGTAPDFRGETLPCSSAAQLTSTRRSALVDQILPRARGTFQALMLLRTSSRSAFRFTSSCSGAKMPAQLRTGVSDADVVVIVTAGATTGNTIAWAYTCASVSSRPVVGHANFGPNYLQWPASTSAKRDQVATAVHEILHSLGFSNSRIKSQFVTRTVRSTSRSLFAGARLKQEAASYYSCSTLAGLDIEDEGGSGSAGSHWDRRVMPYEMMAPAGGHYFSRMTLALMEDLGLGYSGQYSSAEIPVFGRHAGCGFLTEKCSTVAGGKDKWFCFNRVSADCSYDHKATGYCTVSTKTTDYPTAYQYFTNPKVGGSTFFDGCPVRQGYSNGDCEDTTENAIYGNVASADSRCYIATDVIQSGYTSPGNRSRCYKTRCDSKTALSFKIGTGPWHQCATSGQVISNLGSNSDGKAWLGSVTCPNIDIICGGGGQISGLGVFGDAGSAASTAIASVVVSAVALVAAALL